MARSQTLESLLGKLVDSSPVGKSLKLIHITQVAGAFGTCRRTLERDASEGLLTITRFRGGTYFSRQAILEWWQARQARPDLRGRRFVSNPVKNDGAGQSSESANGS
jgi:hypothetical protein